MIALDYVTKYTDDDPRKKPILLDVDFSVRKGQTVGILGHSKVGKTTLINLVNGNARPNGGQVIHRMSASWPIASRQAFNKMLSIRDNVRIIAGMYGAWAPEMLDRIAEEGKIQRSEMDVTLRQLPDAVRSRAAFLLCLALDFDCYVVDETFFIGSHTFRLHARTLIEELRGRKSFVIATKNIQLIRDFCDNCYHLRGHELVLYPNPTSAIRAFRTHDKDSSLSEANTGEESVSD